jgi:hypothetical protein
VGAAGRVELTLTRKKKDLKKYFATKVPMSILLRIPTSNCVGKVWVRVEQIYLARALQGGPGVQYARLENMGGIGWELVAVEDE